MPPDPVTSTVRTPTDEVYSTIKKALAEDNLKLTAYLCESVEQERVRTRAMEEVRRGDQTMVEQERVRTRAMEEVRRRDQVMMTRALEEEEENSLLDTHLMEQEHQITEEDNNILDDQDEDMLDEPSSVEHQPVDSNKTIGTLETAAVRLSEQWTEEGRLTYPEIRSTTPGVLTDLQSTATAGISFTQHQLITQYSLSEKELAGKAAKATEDIVTLDSDYADTETPDESHEEVVTLDSDGEEMGVEGPLDMGRTVEITELEHVDMRSLQEELKNQKKQMAQQKKPAVLASSQYNYSQ